MRTFWLEMWPSFCDVFNLTLVYVLVAQHRDSRKSSAEGSGLHHRQEAFWGDLLQRLQQIPGDQEGTRLRSVAHELKEKWVGTITVLIDLCKKKKKSKSLYSTCKRKSTEEWQNAPIKLKKYYKTYWNIFCLWKLKICYRTCSPIYIMYL